MLGRTLMTPTMWCWCDQDESPDILERCRIKWVYEAAMTHACMPDQ